MKMKAEQLVRTSVFFLPFSPSFSIMNVTDINEFMRGFILTTKGDLQSKIEYTFRIYDRNNDNQISGEEIRQMANVIP